MEDTEKEEEVYEDTTDDLSEWENSGAGIDYHSNIPLELIGGKNNV